MALISGTTEAVATPEPKKSLGETCFEGVPFVGGNALCLSADLLQKQKPPRVCHFPNVVIRS